MLVFSLKRARGLGTNLLHSARQVLSPTVRAMCVASSSACSSEKCQCIVSRSRSCTAHDPSLGEPAVFVLDQREM